jgi:hypothetical protein
MLLAMTWLEHSTLRDELAAEARSISWDLRHWAATKLSAAAVACGFAAITLSKLAQMAREGKTGR